MRCGWLQVWVDTRARYGGRLRKWIAGVGWTVREDVGFWLTLERK